MVFPYIVKHNGIWYPAGTDVPVGAVTVAGNDVIEHDEPVRVYTKTEINRMPVSQLRELAQDAGYSDAGAFNGASLKKLLIKHFDL